MSTTTVKDVSQTKVITGEVRMSYANVWEARAVQDGQDPKFSVCLLIPKKDKATVNAINKAIEFLVNEVKAKNNGKLPKNFKLPLRDGDEEKDEDENYSGMYFINATSKQKPGIVDKQTNPILDRDLFYSGCWGRASINFYAFDKNGNRGIACGLNNLMKTRDDDALAGRASAESDFADFKDGDDDL